MLGESFKEILMPDLPASAADVRADVELDDILDDEAALTGGNAPPSRYVSDEMAREQEDRETLDVLEGLRNLATGDPVRWQIWRIDGADPYKNGFLANWSTTMLTQERMRDEFGPGTYRIEGTRSNGKYLRRRTITIAEDAPRTSRDPKMSAVMAADPRGGFNLQEFLAQQEARDAQRRREDDERRRLAEEKDEKRRAERQQLMLALGPAALAAVAQLFGNRGPDAVTLAAAMRPPPGPDPIAMIAALKQLAPEAPRGPNPMEQALTLFEVLADKAGNSQGRTDWLDVVKEGVKILGPSVGGAIEQTITQARANVQANGASPDGGTNGQTEHAALPAPQGAPVAGAAHGISPETQHAAGAANMLDLLPHIPWLREQLAKLANAASRGRDPDVYAAMFLEELPQGLAPQRVLELLIRSDWLQQLGRFDARIPTQAPWWTQLREDLAGYIQEATAPAPVPKAASGELERPAALPSLSGESS